MGLVEKREIDQLVDFCKNTLTLEDVKLGDEFYYQSLPLCVIDAVFSIGVRYSGVRNVVQRYCKHTSQCAIRDNRDSLPVISEQQSVRDFCAFFDKKGSEIMTTKIFDNRQRTSSKNGILKSDAVLQFARVLISNGVDFLQDIYKINQNPNIEREIRAIAGQSTGISFQYFLMLAGSDDIIKPDRMITRFLESALGRQIVIAEAQALVESAAYELKKTHLNITPRLLDNVIWNFQRQAV